MDQSRNNKTLLFAAGGVTGLIGVTMLVLGMGLPNLAFGADTNQPDVSAEITSFAAESTVFAGGVVIPEAAPTIEVAAPAPAANAQLEQALDQNEQLRNYLQLLLQREEQYRRQLSEANQTIAAMQVAAMQVAATTNAARLDNGSVFATEGAGVTQLWGEGHEDEHNNRDEDDDD